MDNLLDRVENQLAGLVDSISKYQPIEEYAQQLKCLDEESVEQMEILRKHYDACKKLENLQLESAKLDQKINDKLVELADCRKVLESTLNDDDDLVKEFTSLDVEELLDYAMKISRFTRKQIGSEGSLPWPTEDQIRRGMLATLAVQNGHSMTEEEETADGDYSAKPGSPTETVSAPQAEPRKIINLGFSSDEEDD